MVIILLVFLLVPPAYSGVDMMDFVVKESERIWQRKLGKPIELKLKKERTARHKQWPSSWGVNEESFLLGLSEDYPLEASWWASSVDLDANERRILALSHEITHVFMYPTPLVPWFQELVAMKIGEKIAVSYRKKIGKVFDRKVAIRGGDLTKVSYDLISQDLEACKDLQWRAYALAKDLPLETLILWVENLRKIEGYDPIKTYRDFAGNTRLILDAYPLTVFQEAEFLTPEARRAHVLKQLGV